MGYMYIFHVTFRGSKSSTAYHIQASDRLTWWSSMGIHIKWSVPYFKLISPLLSSSKLIPEQDLVLEIPKGFPIRFGWRFVTCSKAMGVIMSFCGGKIYKRHCLWQCRSKGVCMLFPFCLLCFGVDHFTLIWFQMVMTVFLSVILFGCILIIDCWWLKSCSSWYLVYPVDCRFFHILDSP